MKISQIDLYRVRMPLTYHFTTSFGREDAIESVLIRLRADGVEGWGESSPFRLPGYSAEWAAGVFLLLREVLAPGIVGQEIASGDELQARMQTVKGNPFAKAALDLAWWDLHACLTGQPLWRLLGGVRQLVDAGADFGVMESIDDLLQTIDAAVQVGFKRVKLKFTPQWGIEMVHAVRTTFPRLVCHIDCNSAFTLDDLAMFKTLDRYELAMIEQPLAHDDLLDHAELQRQLATPICLDESIVSPEKTRKAIALRACRWVNLKPGRIGGITRTLQIHQLCAEAGIPCWIGGMLESAVGASHCLALATLPNIHYPSDIFPSDRFYARDLATPAMTLTAPSQFRAPDTPGIGTRPDPERLRECTVEQAEIR